MQKTSIPIIDDPMPEVYSQVDTLAEDVSKLDEYVFCQSGVVKVVNGDSLLLRAGMGDNVNELPLTKTGANTLFKAAGMSWASAEHIADIFGIDHVVDEVNKMLPSMDTKYVVAGIYDDTVYRVAPTEVLTKPPSATVLTDMLKSDKLGELDRAVRTVNGVQINCMVKEVDLVDTKFFTGNALSYDPLTPNLALSPLLIKASCKNVMQRKNVGWKKKMQFGITDDQMVEMIKELLLAPEWDNNLLGTALEYSKTLKIKDMYDSISLMEKAKNKLGVYLWGQTELVEQIGERKNGKAIFDHDDELSAFEYMDKYTNAVNQLQADRLVDAMKVGGQILDAIVQDYQIMVSRQQ